MQRRQFLGFIGLFALPLQLLAKARKLTPIDQEGPYYPVSAIPLRSDLIRGDALNNQSFQLHGRVLDINGEPLIGAKIEIWQCDINGVYDHPRQFQSERFDKNFDGFGAQVTDKSGYYTFTTLYPAPYQGRPPHIHVKIWDKNNELLTTQLYLEGNTGGGWFGTSRESLQINPKKNASGQMLAKFTFVV